MRLRAPGIQRRLGAGTAPGRWEAFYTGAFVDKVCSLEDQWRDSDRSRREREAGRGAVRDETEGRRRGERGCRDR